MTPTPAITILGGEITQTSHGETETKETTIRSHTTIKVSKVKVLDSNKDKNKEGEVASGMKRLEELLEGFMTRTESASKNQEAALRDHQAAIKNLENQFGQMAKLLSERPSGKFPADTQEPRMENASAITTRSGKVL